MKLDVQPFIENLRNSLDLTEQKRLLIVHVAGNPASEFYVKSKLKEAEKWNVHCYEARFNEDVESKKNEIERIFNHSKKDITHHQVIYVRKTDK